MKPQEYKENQNWREAFKLALAVHSLSEELPHSEQEALVRDLHESAVAVPTNIALNLIRRQAIDLGPLVQLHTQIEMISHIYPAIETAGIQEHIEKLMKRILDAAPSAGNLTREAPAQTTEVRRKRGRPRLSDKPQVIQATTDTD